LGCLVRDVSEARLRAAFPDCEIAAVGADLQITFELRDLAETYAPIRMRRARARARTKPLGMPISAR